MGFLVQFNGEGCFGVMGTCVIMTCCILNETVNDLHLNIMFVFVFNVMFLAEAPLFFHR